MTADHRHGPGMELSVLLPAWGWTWDEIRSCVLEMEELGYDAVYFGDDLFPHMVGNVDDAVFDPWVVIPALAAITTRIRLGSLISPAGRRHPGHFAKTVANADVISGGRVVLGRGTGNAPEQQATMREPFHSPRQRLDMLADELEIMHRMATQGRTSFDGRHWQVENAVNSPKPLGLEVLVAVASPRGSAKLAAKYADRANLLTTDDDRVSELVAGIAEQCRIVNRDPREILVSRTATLLFTDAPVAPENRDAAIRQRCTEIGGDLESMLFEFREWVLGFIGPSDQCADEICRRTVALGVRELIFSVDTVGTNGYDATMTGLRTFAADVMPQLKTV